MANHALAHAVEPDLAGRPALDAGAVPDAGRPVRGVPGHAGPGAGLPGDLGPAPRPAARARGTDAQQPRRGREGRPGRRHRARGGLGGGRQLGDGLGVARADHRDRGAGADDRRAAAVRPGADRDPGRPGADRPAAAAADQQGRHAGRPRPVRRGLRRGPAGPAPRGPGRHGDPAGARRTAPWASCSSTPGGGTMRWPRWRSCTRT